MQRWLNALPYNTERGGETLRGFRGVVRTGTAHCLEAALSAAVILEQHRYPPLVLSFESIDLLDHVIFVYRGPHGWGSVARSRDPGLHGRKPVFATPRALALSYFEGYIDFTGRIKAYAVVDLRVLGSYDWRLGDGNLWKVERLLLEWPHRRIASSDRRAKRLRHRYRAFRTRTDTSRGSTTRGGIAGRRCRLNSDTRAEQCDGARCDGAEVRRCEVRRRGARCEGADAGKVLRRTIAPHRRTSV